MAMTLDKLAIMMQTQFKDLRTEFKGDVKEVKGEISELRAEMKQGFKNVENRLDIIEGKLINNHENRITRLEDDIRLVKNK